MTTAPLDRLVFSLADWDGPSKRTLIQGVKWNGRMFYVGQADDVPGQSGQDLVIREHDAKLDYTGRTCTIKRGGHGSSFGVELMTDGSTRIYLGHEQLGFGYVVFVDGLGKFVPIAGVPNGDWAIDPVHNLACVRIGTRYQGFTFSTIKAGSAQRIFDVKIYDWGKRFQGHYISRGSLGNVILLVHRDYATKAASRLDVFRIIDNELELLDKIDTTHFGDEAEGVLDYNGWLYVTKRTGGTGAGRIIDCRPTKYTTVQRPKPPAVNPAAGTWLVQVGAPPLFLWGVPVDRSVPRDKWKRRETGFRITTGVRFIDRKDSAGKMRRYLQTEAGWLYATEYLRKVK